MARTMVITEGRALDHVYDPTTTVSGARDFNRFTQAAQSQSHVRVPVHSNMFSELERHPRAVLVPAATRHGGEHGIPPHAAGDFASHVAAQVAPPAVRVEALVHGTQRYKFFRRPNIAIMDAALATIKLDPNPFGAESDAVPAPVAATRRWSGAGEVHVDSPVVNEDGTRSVAMQTAFRDSTAQTDPYTPEYTLPPGAGSKPEILRLSGLKYGGAPGQCLPAGKAEVEAIELARRRARIEASLPPTTDEASFDVRKRLMEAVEMDAWMHRERELDRSQQDRLAAVEGTLRAREAEREFISEQRVEALRRTLADERAATGATLAQRRVKLLRKLGKQRQRNETHVDMLTGTGSFAGVSTGTKAGFGKGRRATRDIIAEYADYGSRVYAPSMRDGRFPDKLRAAAALEVHMPEVLESADSLRGFMTSLAPPMLSTAVGAPSLKKDTTAAERGKEAVARDLERIHGAIKTVKAGKSTTEVENETVPGWRKPKPVVQRPPTPTFDGVDDTPTDEALERAALLLQTLLRGRAVQNVMYEGKERRLELIHEMRADLLTPEAAAAIEAEEDVAHAAETTRVAKDTVADAAAGEVTAAALDFFSKELVRQREAHRIAVHTSAVEAERQRREAAEAAQRAQELAAREAEQERYEAIMAVHAATAATLADGAIADAIGRVATQVAGVETRIRYSFISPLLDRLEGEMEAVRTARARHSGVGTASSAAVVVKDLLSSLVVPAVNMEMAVATADANQAHFASAAAVAIVEAAIEAANELIGGSTGGVHAQATVADVDADAHVVEQTAEPVGAPVPSEVPITTELDVSAGKEVAEAPAESALNREDAARLDEPARKEADAAAAQDAPSSADASVAEEAAVELSDTLEQAQHEAPVATEPAAAPDLVVSETDTPAAVSAPGDAMEREASVATEPAAAPDLVVSETDTPAAVSAPGDASPTEDDAAAAVAEDTPAEGGATPVQADTENGDAPT